MLAWTTTVHWCKSVWGSQYTWYFAALPLMWRIQADCVPQPAEREKCFIHFLSISQCEALAPVNWIPRWNCNIASSVYATINLLICPLGHARELLHSQARVRNAKVQRDTGNIMLGRYKRALVLYHQMSHWDPETSVVDSGVNPHHPTCSWWQEGFGSYNTVP